MPLMIHENFTSVLSDRLKRGDVDVIIISLPFDEPGICTRPLYDEPFVILLPSGHPLAQEVVVWLTAVNNAALRNQLDETVIDPFNRAVHAYRYTILPLH